MFKSGTSDGSLGLGESGGGGWEESVALVSGPLVFSVFIAESTADGPVASFSCSPFTINSIGEES